MTTLGKRVKALEDIAEEIRLRPYRALADRYGIPLKQVIADVEEEGRWIEAMQRRGMSQDEIIDATAARFGVTREEIERECLVILNEG